jgi:cytidylate kinase
MIMTRAAAPYVPGTYAKKRPPASEVASQYAREWEMRRRQMTPKAPAPVVIPPSICLSRKIGVGALEVADILARKLRLRVADREILEHMAAQTKLDKDSIRFFDELYPGKTVELSAMIFGKKSFDMSDYLRCLVHAVYSMAAMGSTIFVGRGTHLILPRERTLAVRFIGSDDYRIRRLKAQLQLDEHNAVHTLTKMDREQRAFFKKAFDRRQALASEFDLVFNFDLLHSPKLAAELVARAFRAKFAAEPKTQATP